MEPPFDKNPVRYKYYRYSCGPDRAWRNSGVSRRAWFHFVQPIERIQAQWIGGWLAERRIQHIISAKPGHQAEVSPASDVLAVRNRSGYVFHDSHLAIGNLGTRVTTEQRPAQLARPLAILILHVRWITHQKGIIASLISLPQTAQSPIVPAPTTKNRATSSSRLPHR